MMKTYISILLLFLSCFLLSQRKQYDSAREAAELKKNIEINKLRNTFEKDITLLKVKRLKKKYQKKYILVSDYFPVNTSSTAKRAKVLTGNGWGLIDEKGKEIIPARYLSISDFRFGITSVNYFVPNKFDKWSQSVQTSYVNFEGFFLRPKYDESREPIPAIQFYYEAFLKKNLCVLNNKEGNAGVFDKDFKLIIPQKYLRFSIGEQYIIGQYEEFRNKKIAFDIYNLKGEFLKQVNYFSLSNYFNGYLLASDESGQLFLNMKTLLPVDDFRFDSLAGMFIDKISGLKVAKYINDSMKKNNKYQTSGENEEVFNNYLIDKNFKVINADYPNANIYQDKFLIQAVHKVEYGRRQYYPFEYNIINLKGEKVANYNVEDFKIFRYFYPDKLIDKEYLEKRKHEWTDLILVDPRYDYEEASDQYRNFYRKDSLGKSHIGVVDFRTGNIKFILDSSEFYSLFPFSDNKHFRLNSAHNQIITDEKGNILKKYNAKDIYNITKSAILIKYSDTSYNFLNPKTFDPIFDKDFKRVEKISENCLVVYDGEKYGIYNLKNQKLNMTNYKYFQKNGAITLYNKNELEIFDLETMEGIFKIGFKKDYLDQSDRDYYKNGFYFFDKYNFVIDQYGTIIDLNDFKFSFY